MKKFILLLAFTSMIANIKAEDTSPHLDSLTIFDWKEGYELQRVIIDFDFYAYDLSEDDSLTCLMINIEKDSIYFNGSIFKDILKTHISIDSITENKDKILFEYRSMDTAFTLENFYIKFMYKDSLGNVYDSLVYDNNYSMLNPIHKKNFDLMLYPNPFNKRLCIKYGFSNIENVSICNLHGDSLIREKNINKQIAYINTTALLPGIYICSIETENGRESRRIIKQ
jgi:hypothetical protein